MSYLEILKRRRAEAGIGGSPATVAGEESGAATNGGDSEGTTTKGTTGVERSLQESPRPGEPLPGHPRTFGAIEPEEAQATAEPRLPDAVLTSRNPLAALGRLALDSLPAASKLNPAERCILADAFESVALQWLSEILKPEDVIREGSTWRANCPKGHRIDDGIFARVLLGWACPECEQVYPASECKLRVRE